MSKHLVLGSRGQVGQYVVAELKERGQEVVEWDIKIDHRHDLSSQERLDDGMFSDQMARVDFVHFLAYEVGGSVYLANNQNSFEFIDTNMRVMHNVFKVLRETNKPFYFASSQMSNMFQSVYGRLKAVGEAYTDSLPNGLNLHFWNVYGYENDPAKTHVITDFIRQGLRDGKILCRTNGDEERDFLYGPDAAKFLCDISMDFSTFKNREFMVHRPHHIAYGEYTSIRKVALEVAHQLGDIPVYFSLDTDKVQDKMNYPSRDFRHIRHTLQEGIKEMIELEKSKVHDS